MSLLPEPNPRIQNIVTDEDPNTSCTWLNYDNYVFSWVDVGVPDYNYSLGEAKEACVELGENKCNAVVGDASHCRRRRVARNGGPGQSVPCGGPNWHPSFIVGEPTRNRLFTTFLISGCPTTEAPTTTATTTTSGDKTTTPARTNSKSENTTQGETTQTATTGPPNGAPRIAFEFLTLIVAVFVLG